MQKKQRSIWRELHAKKRPIGAKSDRPASVFSVLVGGKNAASAFRALVGGINAEYARCRAALINSSALFSLRARAAITVVLLCTQVNFLTSSKMGRRTSSTLTTGNLSNQQKSDIWKHAALNSSKSQDELRSWAMKTFNLAKAPSQLTISNTLKRKKALLSMKPTELVCKRARVLRFPELDCALANWVLYCMQTETRVTGELIKIKAERFAKLLKVNEPCDLVFSNGWLASFKERHGFKSRQCFGESASVCHFTVEASLPLLVETASRFAPQSIYNFDETGLFYELAPDRTISERAVSGTKKSKSRITIAFAVNADGSDKREPLFIETALRPRCFQKKLAVEFGLSYESNKKAWMNGLIFHWWLKHFDRDMVDQGRNVLLILDNASSHTVEGWISTTSKWRFSPPPNTTSELQPLDAGIIASFKRRYRRLHLARAFIREEQGERQIYAVDVLQAMRWTKQCWADITPEIVQNCWRHARILCDALPEKRKNKAEQAVEDRISQCMQSLRISDQLSIEKILSPPNENNVHMGVEDADFVAVAIEVQDDPEEAEEDAEPEMADEEKIRFLAGALRVLDGLDCSNSTRKELRAAYRSISDSVQDRKRQQITQQSLHSYFHTC